MHLKYSLVLLALSLISIQNFAQKSFEVKILLSDNIDSKKIRFFVDDGKTSLPARTEINGNQIVIRGTYFSEYAEIIIYHPRPSSSYFVYKATFFVKEKPAIIEFLETNAQTSPLNSYSLVNAYDFKEEKNAMRAYHSSELKKADDYIAKYGDKIFNGTDSVIANQFFSLDREVSKRNLEYILNNGNSYYAFSYFRRNIIPSNLVSPDSILQIFNSVFPDRFKNSVEGTTIKNILNARISVKENGPAPGFNSVDYQGNKISLVSSPNKNYVLLNFWATWCGPCLAEMPVLKQINDQYASKGLKIISVAYNSTYEKFLNSIKQNKMDWINIYNDVDLINAYGGYKAIPRLYLIDKSGKIIYAKTLDHPDDTQLTRLNQLLTERLNEK